jgi:putative transposase
MLGVTEKSVQRWRLLPELEDRRRGPKASPANKLSEEERAKLVAVATSAEFRDLSVHQIVPRLADRGEYLASESTFYRILNAERLMAHPRPRQAP